MVLSSLGIVITRLIYKRIDFSLDMSIRKILTDNLFKKFMKMKLEDIKSIKNGEIMSYFVRDTKKVARFILRFYSSGVRVVANLVMVIIRAAVENLLYPGVERFPCHNFFKKIKSEFNSCLFREEVNKILFLIISFFN